MIKIILKPKLFGSCSLQNKSFGIPKQEKDEWCWAAVANYIDMTCKKQINFTQCKIAQICLTVLCGNKCQGEYCNSKFFLDTALNKIGSSTKHRWGWPKTGEVMSEIIKGNPVGVRIQWTVDKKAVNLESGHFVAIIGYTIDADDVQYLIYNPAKPDIHLIDEDILRSHFQSCGYWSETITLG